MGTTELQELYATHGESRINYFLGGVGGEDLESKLTYARENQAATIQRIVENIVGSGFEWTGGSNGASGLLDSGNGDCLSLSRGCVALLKALDIEAAVEGYDYPFFINGEAEQEIIDGKRGNIDGRWWIFENHYWVVTDQGTHDLLFRGQAVDSSTWVKASMGHCAKEGTSWWVTESGDKIYVGADGYTLDPEKAVHLAPPVRRKGHSSACCTLV
ncbi:hypothetical protein [Streptomyces vinaceus]|uniref:hypothetical protein n=1 Tax=Streptomyces vinaceus TaxID=1960 RepID=UPI0038102D1C